MQPAAFTRTNPNERSSSFPSRALTELEEAHAHVLAEIANMEAVTSKARFDRCCVTEARWRISRASLQRRKLATRLFEQLGLRANEGDRLALKSLQQAEQEMQRISQAHVGVWTIEKIESEWPVYCKASRTLRWRMEAYIAMAESILCPMIERAERRGPRLSM